MIKTHFVTTLRQLLTAILLSFPIVLLILPAGRRASSYMLFLCALACIVCRVKPGGQTFLLVLKKYWWINLAMAGTLIAFLFHQLAYDEPTFKINERAFQIALFPFFLWVLSLLPTKSLRNLQWSLIIGVASASAALHWSTQGGSVRSVGVLSNPLIPFSNLSLLMGFMILLSIGWNARTERGLIALKIVSWCACLYASYVSGTRGGWIVFPIFVVIAISLKKWMRASHKALIALMVMIAVSTVMSFLPYTKSRMELAYSEAVNYAKQSDAHTSVGVRLQLWDVSWDMFRNNPVFGIGVGGFEKEVKRLAAEGLITQETGLQRHPHNDFLYALATLGVIGAIATFALYFVPGIWFAALAKSPDREQRVTAGMGLAVCLGYFVFGITDTMFYWSFCANFYTIVLAALFALSIKRQEELRQL